MTFFHMILTQTLFSIKEGFTYFKGTVRIFKNKIFLQVARILMSTRKEMELKTLETAFLITCNLHRQNFNGRNADILMVC